MTLYRARNKRRHFDKNTSIKSLFSLHSASQLWWRDHFCKFL